LEDIALEKLLTWATLNGAKALGIGDRKGSIEVGKRPGLVVIEGADLASMKLSAESVSHRII
jgi:imidazolonepropionase-like amidohydrolase